MIRTQCEKMVLLLALGISALTAPSTPARATPGNPDVSDGAFVQWVREYAVQLDTVNWRDVDLAKLSILDKALEGKRIVYLGEADHYVREKYDFQLTLIRYLFDRGWRHIGAEMGRADGKRIDRYLETGDTAWLDRVASYGYKGDFRTGRSDIPKGLVPAKGDRDFRRNVRAEQYWFQKQLRSLNECLPPGGRRLHWFGFDADLRAGGGYVDVTRLVGPRRSEPLAREILRRATRVDGESRAEEIQRLQDLTAFLERKDTELEACVGKAEAVELKRTLRALTAGFLFAENGKDGPMSSKWHHALRTREETMFRQMDDVLADLAPDEKIILLGHLMHLSKDSASLQFGAMGGPFASAMWPSIGDYLAKKMPDEVYSIWMLCDHGRHGVPMLEKPIEAISSRPDRIEYHLAKAGSIFLLPLHTGDPREAYLKRKHNFLNNGQYGNAPLDKQADALFFVAEVHEPGGPEAHGDRPLSLGPGVHSAARAPSL